MHSPIERNKKRFGISEKSLDFFVHIDCANDALSQTSKIGGSFILTPEFEILADRLFGMGVAVQDQWVIFIFLRVLPSR